MNRTRFAMVLLTFALVTAFAAAASAMPSVGMFEITGGYAKSTLEAAAPFSTDSPGGGMSFGCGYFRSIAPRTSWGMEASYDNLGSMSWNDGTDNHNTSLHMLRMTPELRMNFGAPVGPSFCAQAGAGYYSVSSNDENATTSVTTSGSNGKFGFNFGAGMGFPVGPKTKLNIMGTYHTVSTPGTSTNYMNFRCGLGLSL